MKLTTVSFGNYSDLTKKSIYARIGDSAEAVVVSTEKFNKLNKELNDLRDPAVTGAAVDAATSIDILTPGSDKAAVPTQITLTRKMGSWQIASAGLPGDSTAIEAFLSNLKNLRANKYVDGAGDLKAIGLDPPAQTIMLTITGQSAPEVIEIGKPEAAEPLTPVRRRGEATVYLVQTPDVAKLAISLLNFRDRAIETLSPDLIHKIEIEGEITGGKVTLEHQGTTWKVLKDGKTVAADGNAVSAYLANFTPVMAKKWITTLPNRAQKVTATIRITMDAPVTTTAPASTMEALSVSKPIGPATAPGIVVKTLDIFKENDGTYSANMTPAAAGDTALGGWSFEPTAELVRQTLVPALEPKATTQAATQSTTTPATAP